jgi:transcriptional regulator with GAF, ATPase, and Fis domain
MPAKLVVVAGPRCGEIFLLDSNDITIGRDAASQLSIPDHLMSRRHCTVEPAAGSFTLRDLGSSNGTYVNGIPIRERVLEHGDRIRAGDSLLLFLQLDAEGDATASVGVDAAFDDLTHRIRREDIDSDRRADEAADIQKALVAEVLAGRMTLPAHDMVGDTPPMRAVYDRIGRVAPSDCTVLISGETGTGKELAARAIHQNSPRARRPFVAVNCAVLTESLLESELFGHEKGAFTGAIAMKKGKFEIADGGTLFLDEVGELALGLQAKFLRALQHREFERVGSTRTIKADVRVIAASNKDLQTAAAAGHFRQDLLYRLNVVNLMMPPLRARRADIPMLAAHFAVKYSRGRTVALSREALETLRTYDWPGNVRELENAIERAVVLGSSDRIVVDDLPEAVVAVSVGSLPHASAAAYHRTVLETKRRLIVDAIDRSDGNYTAAARLLGINPTYLHRLVRNLQLRDTTASRG